MRQSTLVDLKTKFRNRPILLICRIPNTADGEARGVRFSVRPFVTRLLVHCFGSAAALNTSHRGTLRTHPHLFERQCYCKLPQLQVICRVVPSLGNSAKRSKFTPPLGRFESLFFFTFGALPQSHHRRWSRVRICRPPWLSSFFGNLTTFSSNA